MFLSHNFKSFCEKFSIEIIYCTFGYHRSNGLVEKLVDTVKSKFLAMSFDLPKSSLNSAIKKIVWNLRIRTYLSISCFFFEKKFHRRANNRWKILISSDNRSDKGEPFLSDHRARNWKLHDGAEDGYLAADMETN